MAHDDERLHSGAVARISSTPPADHPLAPSLRSRRAPSPCPLLPASEGLGIVRLDLACGRARTSCRRPPRASPGRPELRVAAPRRRSPAVFPRTPAGRSSRRPSIAPGPQPHGLARLLVGRARSAAGPCCPCPAALAVPVGLTVPHEKEGRHGRYRSDPWTRHSRQGPVSSPARPEGSGSRSRNDSPGRARRRHDRAARRRAGVDVHVARPDRGGACGAGRGGGWVERFGAHRLPREQRRRHRDPHARRAD